MKSIRIFSQSAALLCTLLAVSPARCADVTSETPPVGGIHLDLPQRGSAIVSIPLNHQAACIGRVAAFGAHSLTFSGVNWTPGQFAPASGSTYFAQFVTGNLAGLVTPILSNDATTVTVDTNGHDLTAHPLHAITADAYDAALKQTAYGDLVCIRAAWTVSEIFGADEAGVALSPWAAGAAIDRGSAGDRVLIPNNASAGVYKAPAAVLGYVAGAGWRRAGGAGDQGGFAFLPGAAAVVQRSAQTPAMILAPGYVQTFRAVTELPGDATLGNDLIVGSTLAEPIALQDSGLGSQTPGDSIFSVSVSPNSRQRIDLLQILGGDYLNLWDVQNEFVYLSSGWEKVGAPGVDAGPSVAYLPGHGFRLRLQEGSPGGFWLQAPTY